MTEIENIYTSLKQLDYRLGIHVVKSDKLILSYNADQIFDTACSIMVFIMLQYFKCIKEGSISGYEELIYTEENYATGSGTIKYLPFGSKIKASDLIELMIIISDHIAANMLIDFLGLENINNTIKENNFKFTKLNHKFLIPKLKNMGSTTPADLCEFYLKLDNEEFLDWECCNKMKQILLKQHYKDILTGKIQKSENENFLDVASKSGKADGRIYDNNTDSYIADAGIMICKNGNYSLAVLAEVKAGAIISLNEVKDYIQTLALDIFDYVNRGKIF